MDEKLAEKVAFFHNLVSAFSSSAPAPIGAPAPPTRSPTPPTMATQWALFAVPVPEPNVLAAGLETRLPAHVPSRKVAKDMTACFKRIKDGVDAVHDCWRRMGERNQVRGCVEREGSAISPMVGLPTTNHPHKPTRRAPGGPRPGRHPPRLGPRHLGNASALGV